MKAFVCSAAVVFLLGAASAAPAIDARAAVLSAYKALQAALLKNDAAALSALLTIDFSSRGVDGTIEKRDAYVKDQTENNQGVTLSSSQFVVTKLTIQGNGAEADAILTYTGTYVDNGTTKPFRSSIHRTDEWTVEAGSWKLRSSTERDEVTYVDGKIVQQEQEQLPPTNAAIAELRTRAVVIPTFALDADPEQFGAIGTAIGDARIVGMGEGSHGSSEFFAFKNRLFKYLVEKKGFTIFAMEAYWGAGLYVDRYIKTGRGTAQQAVASLAFWTWDAPEVVDIVQWMHDYNAKPGKHPILTFAGVDMQDPMGAIGYLATYVPAHDPAEVATARAALACATDSASQYSAKPAAGCRAKVAAIGVQLATLKRAPDAAVASEAVVNILQYLDFKAAAPAQLTQANMRDHDMAQNTEWLAAHYPHAKIALWAHNGHVGSTWYELSYHTMGTYLRRAFGADYYVIGQTFGSGTVRAIVRGHGLQPVPVPANPNDTIAALFAPLDAAAFVNLRGLRAGSALQTYFSTQHGIEEIGATIDPQHPEYQKLGMVIPNSFDGLVYVPTSTAATNGISISKMRRDVHENGTTWQVSGVGFDDVTISTSPSGALLTNRDGLNSTPNTLARRFDAAPYAGQSVRVTGEARRDDLLGFTYTMAKVTGSNGSTMTYLQGEQIGATENWVPFTLQLKVPAHAAFIDAGFSAWGLGSVEVRNLAVSATLPSPSPSPAQSHGDRVVTPMTERDR